MNAYDTEAIRVGARLWSMLRRDNVTPLEARQYVAAHIGFTGRDKDAEFAQDNGVDRAYAYALWADAGFPLFDIDGSYAAALMATDAPKEVRSTLPAPYRSFAVRLPRGLLSLPNGVSFDRLWLVQGMGGDELPDCDDERMVICHMSDSVNKFSQSFGSTGDTEDFFSHEMDVSPASRDGYGDTVTPEHLRAGVLARRVLSGILYALHYRKDDVRYRDARMKRHMVGRQGPPTHRVWTIGRALSVDCRPWVREYLDTGRVASSPTVQSLVRGHFKMQPVGPGRADRRSMWIQPYWRGPEDAPILVRPIVVGA